MNNPLRTTMCHGIIAKYLKECRPKGFSVLFRISLNYYYQIASQSSYCMSKLTN